MAKTSNKLGFNTLKLVFYKVRVYRPRPFAGNSELEYKTIDNLYMRIAANYQGRNNLLFCTPVWGFLQRVYS
jgi:hypothetical protein